mmetsp:Transcript_101353/g.175033  ORF Transcript_101353/g.175033 Transcript_101353/m.175033 type:complete len:94 (+) Transcript_101353:501-782(+)
MLNHEVPFHGYLPSQIPSTCDVVDANHGWKVQIRGSTVDLDGDWRPQNLLACLQKPANGKKSSMLCCSSLVAGCLLACQACKPTPTDLPQSLV